MKTIVVDLRFSGAHAFLATGTKGECTGTGGKFGVSLSATDYPGLGQQLVIAEATGGRAQLTWQVDDRTAYVESPNAVLALSPDRKSIRIDDELNHAATVQGQHVTGTISCP